MVFCSFVHTEDLHWYGVNWNGPITFGDTDESVVVPPVDNPLAPAIQEILLQEIDPASDDVDSGQIHKAVCVFVRALA